MADFDYEKPSLQRKSYLHFHSSYCHWATPTIDQVVLQDDVILQRRFFNIFSAKLDFKSFKIASSKSLKSFKLTWQKEFGKKIQSSRSIEIRIQDPNARARDLQQWQWLSCSIGSYSQAKRNTLSHFLSGTQSTTFTAQDHGSTFMTCGWS